ncbi:MAG TPA: hypothetical protein VLA09_13785 [Longimicrobiales bacterium]|nr:hypothetical protein [Longimicrobiales bacterium]
MDTGFECPARNARRCPITGFVRRDLIQVEKWVAAYESFVDQLDQGYSMSVHEYTNDLHCRQLLHDARAEPQVKELWRRVEVADAKLRGILRPTKRCLHGSNPPTCFWYWGYPPNSPGLESDLRSIGAL